MKKKNISLLVGLFLALYSVTATANNVPWLQVDGLWLKDMAGNKVQLRGFSIEDPEELILKWSAGKSYDYIIDRALPPYLPTNVIRVPIHPHTYEKVGKQKYIDEYMKPVVDYIISKGAYVIIDWHPISDYVISQYNSVDWAPVTNAFWDRIAPMYADVPNVIYEIFNEPINPSGKEAWDTWRSIAQPWVNTIRKHAPNNIIIVNSPHWSHNTSYAVDRPFEGTNLIYAIHFYPYHNMTQPQNDFFYKELVYPIQNLPVFVTEWGWQNDGDHCKGGSSTEVCDPYGWYPDTMKAIFEEYHHVNWVAWNFSENWYPWTVEGDFETFLPSPVYQGTWMKEYLEEIKDRYQPQLVPTAVEPRSMPVVQTGQVQNRQNSVESFLLNGSRMVQSPLNGVQKPGASNVLIQKVPADNSKSRLRPVLKD